MIVNTLYRIFQIGERAFSDGQLGFTSSKNTTASPSQDAIDGNHCDHDNSFLDLSDHDDDDVDMLDNDDEAGSPRIGKNSSTSSTTATTTLDDNTSITPNHTNTDHLHDDEHDNNDNNKQHNNGKMNFADFIFFHLSFLHYSNYCSNLSLRTGNSCLTHGNGNNGNKLTENTFLSSSTSNSVTSNTKPSASTLVSLRYWFRCLDVDDKGYLTLDEIEYWYQQQAIRYFEPQPVPSSSSLNVSSSHAVTLPSEQQQLVEPMEVEHVNDKHTDNDDECMDEEEGQSDSEDDDDDTDALHVTMMDDDEEITFESPTTMPIPSPLAKVSPLTGKIVLPSTTTSITTIVSPSPTTMIVIPNVSVQSYLQQFLHFLYPHCYHYRYHHSSNCYNDSDSSSNNTKGCNDNDNNRNCIDRITLDDLIHHNAGKSCISIFHC